MNPRYQLMCNSSPCDLVDERGPDRSGLDFRMLSTKMDRHVAETKHETFTVKVISRRE